MGDVMGDQVLKRFQVFPDFWQLLRDGQSIDGGGRHPQEPCHLRAGIAHAPDCQLTKEPPGPHHLPCPDPGPECFFRDATLDTVRCRASVGKATTLRASRKVSFCRLAASARSPSTKSPLPRMRASAALGLPFRRSARTCPQPPGSG